MKTLRDRYRSGEKLGQSDLETLAAELGTAIKSANRPLPALSDTDLVADVAALEAALSGAASMSETKAPVPAPTALQPTAEVLPIAGALRGATEAGAPRIRAWGPGMAHGPQGRTLPDSADRRQLVAAYESAKKDPVSLSDFLDNNRKALVRLFNTPEAA
jgi:hypothetical protein